MDNSTHSIPHDTSNMLAVSIGNSITQLGLFSGDEHVATWCVTTPTQLTECEAKTILMNFAASLGHGSKLSFTGSIVASVAPTITDTWVSALASEIHQRPLVVGPGLKSGIKLGYSDPSELGADRIAGMVGARDLFGSPLILINLETTTTFEVITDNGEFAGGIIAPGLETSASRLSSAAAKIPVVDLKIPTTAIGKSTRAAVQAGVVLGEVARIDGLVHVIWQELGYNTKVVATGSNASVIAAISTTINETVNDVVLHGLHLLYKRNTK